ncbi:hypothetical protein CH259_16600 [Rhodococcus sp. 05-2254-4]|uniref:HNH endonuclease signature motif containing protein n=1 Tax=unclassified Rhodococcus (in: high G+C Gram-positive bacteria) TaxID=192944 RepID=UPI000B9B8627|nr:MULTISPECIES: HNH endonuclease signature motif containing protein [unclassified Rhodococcus (in: high G+C Gram-positive bacteria)]OZE35646.1 hypothetical protein CH259_16600 [Rhodococcus sp. 05-2254-4]OZE48075.1 hypothetical protein CH261_09195 [Rhodococcus sp. 05-2254-3]OZE49286.1 hypothetical protein CH283_16980 [Rhodococcus sp. 05-2254-2]
MRAGAFTNDTRLIIEARAMGVCEICMNAPIQQFHHRRPRGSGGTRRPETAYPSNGLALCSPCHATVESNRDESYRLGYLVRQQHDPEDVAVWIGGRFVMLTDSGLCKELPEEAD